MQVVLHSMTREPEKGRVRVTVQFGDETPKQFLGESGGDNEGFTFCNIEQELVTVNPPRRGVCAR